MEAPGKSEVLLPGKRELERLREQLERTRADLQERIDMFSLLNQVGILMHSTLSLEDRVGIVLTAVTAGIAMGFNRAILLLVNRETWMLEGKMGIGARSLEEAQGIWEMLSHEDYGLEELARVYRTRRDSPGDYLDRVARKMAFPIASLAGIPSLAVIEKKAYNISQAREDPRVNPRFIELLGAEAFAVLPLINQGEVIAVLVADNLFTRNPIGEEQMQMLETFGHEAALSIGNALAHKGLEEHIDQLQEANRRLKETRDLLVRSEKLAAVGQMAAQVAHEIRNPLVAIGGFAKLLKRRMVGKEEDIKYVNAIAEEVARLEGIVSDVLDFASPRGPYLTRGSVVPILEETIVELSDQLRARGIRVEKEWGEEIPHVLINTGQIKQVFLNLLENGSNCMDGKGTITIVVKEEGDSLCISVSDTGPGIPEEHLDKVFVPFFTTRERGFGLGLAVVEKIMRQHNGSIEVSNRSQGRTTFTVRFPIS